MIPRRLFQWLVRRPGPIGSYALAYREFRWGDPHVRLLRILCDRRRASVDIGAHAGAYTWFLRRYSRGCIAFEPNPQLAAILKRRFPTGVTIFELALSDHPGRARLRVPLRSSRPDPGRATIEEANRLDGASGVHDAMEVPTATLDQLVREPVGFIKIDVEGHELKVLQGGERILRQHRPNLILELEEQHHPGIVAAVFAHLREHGYLGWFLCGGDIMPLQAFSVDRHQAPDRPLTYVNNFIFSVDPATGDRLRR